MTPTKQGAGPQADPEITTAENKITRTDSALKGATSLTTWTTTRTCGGAGCWCHVGQSWVESSTEPDNNYRDWRQRMDSLANSIRYLEVRQGVPA
jgi:hypothetical protein